MKTERKISVGALLFALALFLFPLDNAYSLGGQSKGTQDWCGDGPFGLDEICCDKQTENFCSYSDDNCPGSGECDEEEELAAP
jgi:hypothetical protein